MGQARTGMSQLRKSFGIDAFMRRFALAVIVCVITAGCERPAAPAQPAAATTRAAHDAVAVDYARPDQGPLVPADALRPDDFPVIDAALSYFMSDREVHLSALRPQLVVHHATAGGSGFVRVDQVSTELPQGKVPTDAMADLEARNNSSFLVRYAGQSFTSTNRAPASLAGFRPQDPNVLLRDLDAIPQGNGRWDFDEAFFKAHPQARGFAKAVLPGYTADKRRAVVRLAFGPSPHGAVATYLLEKGPAGKWKVIWGKVSYFA